MSPVSARRALEYAISPPVLRLFGVILLGGVLLQFGIGSAAPGPNLHGGGVGIALGLVTWLVGVALTVVGLLALYGGIVALLYKIIVDALGEVAPLD